MLFTCFCCRAVLPNVPYQLNAQFGHLVVIKSHLVNVFNNNRPNSKQTLILPVHIKCQLSYAAITEKFCIRKLYNLEESQAKEECQKNANGFTIMAKLS